MTVSVRPATRVSAALLGLLGLVFVAFGVVAFVDGLRSTPSEQFGLVTGPLIALIGSPAVLAAWLLWRNGRGWWLGLAWAVAGLAIGLFTVWQESQPGGSRSGLGPLTLGFGIVVVALLIGRPR